MEAINTKEMKEKLDPLYAKSREERNEILRLENLQHDIRIINGLISSHTLEEMYEGIQSNSSTSLRSELADLRKEYSPSFDVSYFYSIGIVSVFYLKGKTAEQYHKDRGPRINGVPRDEWIKNFGDKREKKLYDITKPSLINRGLGWLV